MSTLATILNWFSNLAWHCYNQSFFLCTLIVHSDLDLSPAREDAIDKELCVLLVQAKPTGADSAAAAAAWCMHCAGAYY
jgi:hypothetical protein